MSVDVHRIVVPPRLREWTRDEWTLYFDPANFVWSRVNQSGRWIVERLRGYRPVDEIAQEAATTFGLTPEAARAAVERFVEGHVTLGLLHHDEYRPRPRAAYADRPFALHVYLHMTNACNLRCPYCYNKDDREAKLRLEALEQRSPTLTTDEYARLITRLVEEGVERLFFTGGEPLMRPDVLELAAHARAEAARLGRHVALEMLTNGILLKGETAARVCELFETVTISLDGHERHLHEHYRGRNTFAPTVRGVRTLLAARHRSGREFPNVCLVPALTDRNIGFMQEIYAFALDELGVDWLAPIIFQAGDHQELSLRQIPPLDAYVRESARTGRYLQARRDRRASEATAAGAAERPAALPTPVVPRHHCGVGHGEISIDPSGTVYPCQSLHFDEFMCGNVRAEDVRTIFERSPVMQRVRGTKVQTLSVCRHCDLQELCNGGCRATAYNVYRDFDAHNEIYCRHLELLATQRLWGASDLPLEEAVGVGCSPN